MAQVFPPHVADGIVEDFGPPYFVIIEDDHYMRELCGRFLWLQQYSVCLAGTEEAAYDFLINHGGDVCAVFAGASHFPSNLSEKLLTVNRIQVPRPLELHAAAEFYLAVVDRYVPESAMVLFEAGATGEAVKFWLDWERADARLLHIRKPIQHDSFRDFCQQIRKWWDTKPIRPISSEVALVSAASDELAIACARAPDFLDRLSPRQFEELVGSIFRNQGCQVELTSKTRDGGYDLAVVLGSQFESGRAVVEVKHYRRDRPAGVDIVRKIYGVKALLGAEKCYLVTSSSVSDYAKREFSRVIPRELEFMERHDVLEWCRRYYPELLQRPKNDPD